ncbi:hypothetical protein C1646_673330 [Rhizophagus diaphanus]|nr:hypothetical protein C1646_673330 [Rhizophagus diaphanus] [Rhizophagus sp. MUCL 43196]
MFFHLCMKYIFFLLAIATIVAGIPLEETRNLPLEETQDMSLSRRQDPLGVPRCTDHNYPLLRSSFCRNMTFIASVCESQDFPGTFTTSDIPCQPDASCVDFVRPDDSIPRALCVSNERRSKWDNDRTRGILCDSTRYMKLNADILTIGMTTYDINSHPIQVNVLDGYVNDVDLGIAFQQHNYSKVYKNYVANQGIKLCFAAGSEQLVTAIAAILVPSGTNEELAFLSLE